MCIVSVFAKFSNVITARSGQNRSGSRQTLYHIGLYDNFARFGDGFGNDPFKGVTAVAQHLQCHSRIRRVILRNRTECESLDRGSPKPRLHFMPTQKKLLHRLLGVCVQHAQTLSGVLYVASLAAFLGLPLAAKRNYLDENALLAGFAHSQIRFVEATVWYRGHRSSFSAACFELI